MVIKRKNGKYTIDLCLVLVWFSIRLEQGGVDAIHKVNLEKAHMVISIQAIFIITRLLFQNYECTIYFGRWSFRKAILAEENHLLNLAGHRSVGGIVFITQFH